jgi:polysaccharide deacetylase family sporulation protein PdaB
MRIYVFNFRRLLIYLLIIAAAVFIISVIGLKGMDALEAFSGSRELPIYSVDCGTKTASITFDCAWGADDIADILKTLKEADVKATFFIVGQWAEKYPDKVRMIASEGHDIANHSHSHLRMGSLDRERVKSEIKQANSVLEKITGSKVELFRAPYGDYTDSVIDSARELGCYTIQWNVDSLDWKPDIAKETIMSRICSKTVPGSIILFHNDTRHTAKILSEVISTLKKMGYELMPVSKLIMRENYIIDNEGRQKTAD